MNDEFDRYAKSLEIISNDIIIRWIISLSLSVKNITP